VTTAAPGTFQHPLASVDEPCPECGSELTVPHDHFTLMEYALAKFLLPDDEYKSFRNSALVRCPECLFAGTARK
jgi:hypothetical protein